VKQHPIFLQRTAEMSYLLQMTV